MKYLLILVLSIIPLLCIATIYEQTDNASTTYSDTPLNNSSSNVYLPPKVQNSSPGQTVTTTTTAVKTDANNPYSTFIIESPKDQETIQNQPIISVIIKVEPELKPTDKIQLFLDGKAYGSPLSATKFELANVERGSHQLSATLINDKQMILKQTSTITLYVHRNSILTNPINRGNS